MTIVSGVDALRQQRPEWTPWLAVVDEVVRESMTAQWDAAVPEIRESPAPSAPLLDGATIVVNAAAVRGLFKRSIDIASHAGTAPMATLSPELHRDLDIAELFATSVRQDSTYVTMLAERYGADAQALQAIVALLAVPWLQACGRQWGAAVPVSWMEGCCPICAAWPAFIEVRGIERSRHPRCGRCGSEWFARLLHCTYCGNHDHDEFVTLVPEKAGSGAVEACRRCHGYMKTFTTLQGCAPHAVMVRDLGSVELDVAALAQGYSRPSGAGFLLTLTVHSAPAARRFFAWNT